MLELTEARDDTGCAVCPLLKRADVLGMQAAQVSMARAGLSIAQQIFVLGFLQFLYWPPTISMALGQILAALPSTRRCRKVWQGSGLKTVVGVLRKARTDIVSNTNSMSIKCDGSGSHFLVAKPAVRSSERTGSAKFFHPRMNPSERRPGKTAGFLWNQLK